MPGMTHAFEKRRVNWRAIGSATGIGAVVAIVIALALGLATYAAAASYKSVSALATRLGVPLAGLCPIGIDGGLLAIIVFDITLTIIGRPIRWLRMVGRLFAVGVVAANFAAGWPDPVGIALRLAAPVLFIVIIEAARTVLLHRHDDPDEERIPRIRWLLDFRGTFALWKRMRLWKERSYSRAVEMELERLVAIEKLAMKYAPDEWTEKAPAHLVWMLRAGVRMTAALDLVAEITAPAPEPKPTASGGSGREASRPRAGSAAGNGNRARKPQPVAVAVSPDEVGDAPEDLDSEAKVLWYLDRGLSASKAGVKAGLHDSRGRQIARLRKPAPKGIDEGGSS